MASWTVKQSVLAFDVAGLVADLGRGRDDPRVEVRRPDDLLVLTLRLRGLVVRSGQGGPRLVRQDEQRRPTLLVDLPPQSFAEEAYPLPSVPGYEPPTALPAARARMSGPSRLAFVMPDELADVPYTLAGVLEAMRTWPESRGVAALPDPGPEGSDRIGWHDVLDVDVLYQGVTTLTAALTEAGAGDAHEQIVAAGVRVAARAAGALAAGPAAMTDAALRAMDVEVRGLHERVPRLRTGSAQEATTAALALASAASLVATAGELRRGIDFAAAVPYLPVLLRPRPPAETVTALELPYRLLLSPIESACWQHRDTPGDHGGRTELWHTRLRTADGVTGPDGLAKVRALWSPDYPREDFSTIDDEEAPRPFRMSLKAQDRQSLVRLMAGFDEVDDWGKRFIPRSSRVRRLQLTSLGAIADLEGGWEILPAGVDLEQWRHIAALGRDQYVRVVYRGYLLPCGHNASLMRVTERTFGSLDGDPARRVALLRQRYFIVVRKRIVELPFPDHVHHGHNLPFTAVELLTRVTPDLALPGIGDSALVPDGADVIYGAALAKDKAFWPVVPKTPGPGFVDVQFEAVGTDICGARISFHMPMLFVSKEANRTKAPEIRRAYDRPQVAPRRTADLGGATVCFAPYTPGDKGDSRLSAASMTFRAGERSQFHPTQPNFHPEVDVARVGIKPVQKLLGQPKAVVDVTYPEIYKSHGYDADNAGGLFLQVINAAHTLAFGGGAGAPKTDALGGLAAPGMAILGLSRVMGPTGAQPPADMTDRAQVEAALAKIVGNVFDPKDVFKGATILGGVDLADLLDVVGDLAGAEVPKLLSRELPPAAPTRVEASFDWHTQVTRSDPLKLVVPRADPAHPTTLSMQGLVTTPLADPSAASANATAELTNFKVNLFGFIIIWFDDLHFSAASGRKPDVAVGIHPDDGIRFGGPLEFVNELRKVIPSNGFSDPPSLSVTPSGIAASYSLNLPGIGVGIFSLTNASLGAGFELPFDATPASVRFNFSERAHPFSLTVSLLGGGGFFAIGISARGVQEIEAALEFGAQLSIDLGVASGGVEIKAGVYFHWKETIPDKGSVELAGYIRLHGELSVLGLISASLTFNLQLAYRKDEDAHTSVVWGEATLTVEVDIAFISFDVSVSCRKELAGGAADPRFIDLIPDEPTWAEYCGAFAVEV
jgi:hypothetical protein